MSEGGPNDTNRHVPPPDRSHLGPVARALPEERERPLPRITQITHDIAQYTDNLLDFEGLLEEHELLVQGIIQQPRAKELYFNDYWGEIKSLGGWGGDFVLATSNKSEEETKAYFQKKGFDTILKYNEMIKEY